MEDGNGVLNILEVRSDLQPAAEAPPLAPGGGVFIEDGGRGPLSVLGGVGTALAVFAWPEEKEEGDSGEIADGNIS